jgi:phosphoglycolate phosphatase
MVCAEREIPKHLLRTDTSSGSRSAAKAVQAILFDKDGTLIDFERTWGPAVHDVMKHLAGARHAIFERLAAVSGFVEGQMRFLPDSLLVAHPIGVWGPLWAGELGCQANEAFVAELNRLLCEATTAHLLPIGNPGMLINTLVRRGYRLGVFSSDAEMTVRAHMRKLGVERMLQFMAGYDSGFGCKPDPGPVLAFAKAVSVDPSRTAVVGDTTLDLAAARAAGAVAVAVLTGPTPAETLSPAADVILGSAEDVAQWVVG